MKQRLSRGPRRNMGRPNPALGSPVRMPGSGQGQRTKGSDVRPAQGSEELTAGSSTSLGASAGAGFRLLDSQLGACSRAGGARRPSRARLQPASPRPGSSRRAGSTGDASRPQPGLANRRPLPQAAAQSAVERREGAEATPPPGEQWVRGGLPLGGGSAKGPGPHLPSALPIAETGLSQG